MSTANNEVILNVVDLKKYFPIKQGFLVKKTVAHVKAVDEISFHVVKGKTFALVGESGCGKTTVARTVLRVLNPTSGKIVFENTDISNLRYA